MLGTMPDAEVALEVNRTPVAVRLKREKLGIPRRHYRHRPWTPEEDELVRTLPPKEVSGRTGRRLRPIYMRRHELRAADPRPLGGEGEEEAGEGEGRWETPAVGRLTVRTAPRSGRAARATLYQTG